MAKKVSPISPITEQLQHWNKEQDPEANNLLLNLVYDELNRQARRYLKKERVGHILQTTALVHVAYLKLLHQKNVEWKSRSHFFGIAATKLRRTLIDYAKTRHRSRRGGLAEDLSLENVLTIAVNETDFDQPALDEALNRLAEKEERLTKIVELGFLAAWTCLKPQKS